MGDQGFMERAMGIELRSENISLGVRRCYHRSKSQLVPTGAELNRKLISGYDLSGT